MYFALLEYQQKSPPQKMLFEWNLNFTMSPLNVTHLFPMHPFYTPCKTVRFSDIFRG